MFSVKIVLLAFHRSFSLQDQVFTSTGWVQCGYNNRLYEEWKSLMLSPAGFEVCIFKASTLVTFGVRRHQIWMRGRTTVN